MTDDPELASGFEHEPVMLDEVVASLERIPAGVFVDGTLGGGGHASAVLDRFPGVTLHGIDQDEVAREAATTRLARFGDRAVVHAARFDEAAAVLAGAGVEGISGFLLDLGVSSPQLDIADRGFSYHNDGPLDMRMDRSRSLTAAAVVNEYPIGELIDVLRSYGDERHAPRIARAIVAARPLGDTAQLAAVIADATPAAARRTQGHPARRSFQAIRIEVNDELGILGSAIDGLLDLLVPGGVALVLTYHSGEDRIAKDRFRSRVEGAAPAGLPVRTGFSWLFRGARTASQTEIDSNPRARSARLRGVIRDAEAA